MTDTQATEPNDQVRKPASSAGGRRADDKPAAGRNNDAGDGGDKDKNKDKDDRDGGDDKAGDHEDAGDKGGDDKKEGDDKQVAPEKKKKIRIALFAFGGLAVVIGLGWLAWHLLVGRYHEETDDAFLQADTVTVAPKVGGYVEEVLVKDNQDVKAGQALARIDARDYRAQTEQFEAQIAIAKANADAVRAQIGEQESAVAEARAQLEAARASAGFANNEVRRYAPLVDIGAENGETLAQRRNQATQSDKQVAVQRAALANAEKRITSLRAQVRQAEAQAGTAEAQLKAANVNLQSTLLTASIAGRVGDQTVRVGQFVQPGARLMSLVPTGSLYITANFKETQIGRMRIGQPAAIKVDALPGVDLHGRIESFSPGTGAQFSLLPPQNATGNFTKIVQRVPVRIAVDTGPETRQLLVPGLSVKVEIDTSDNKDAIKRAKHQEKRREDGREDRRDAQRDEQRREARG
ncbi:HlyD family secretion protein [Massilia forsythiae]|uniref:HlyD family secretion protein n=1 Tax=Massilia forsythiae TaxID=2728020 RepID=A0A7Z2ZVI2_9BURK|nr:HlyD family secretion protein [Massilia forsythiae]QJE02112.1 HlyD family secretion protein [Massilia forsythiae]